MIGRKVGISRGHFHVVVAWLSVGLNLLRHPFLSETYRNLFERVRFLTHEEERRLLATRTIGALEPQAIVLNHSVGALTLGFTPRVRSLQLQLTKTPLL